MCDSCGAALEVRQVKPRDMFLLGAKVLCAAAQPDKGVRPFPGARAALPMVPPHGGPRGGPDEELAGLFESPTNLVVRSRFRSQCFHSARFGSGKASSLARVAGAMAHVPGGGKSRGIHGKDSLGVSG